MARIMLADDSEAIRQVLRDILSIGNHQIAGETMDGDETIEKFDEYRPDLLLLDLSMPKKDGLTVTQEIIEKHPDAKIIVITASDNQEVIKDCIEAGASAHISKPFEFDEVLKIISKVIPD